MNKKKLILIRGGVLFASSLPLIALHVKIMKLRPKNLKWSTL